jgi:hypothetical protein
LLGQPLLLLLLGFCCVEFVAPGRQVGHHATDHQQGRQQQQQVLPPHRCHCYQCLCRWQPPAKVARLLLLLQTLAWLHLKGMAQQPASCRAPLALCLLQLLLLLLLLLLV